MASVNFIGSMFTVSRWCIMLIFIAITCPEIVAGNDYRLQYVYLANVNITYKDPKSGKMTTERTEMGQYVTASHREPEWGWVVHIRSANNMTDGCEPPVNVPSVRWVALVKRGACKFHQKIHNAAIVRNASAVVIYDSQDDTGIVTMEHKVDDVLSIFISQSDGTHIARLVDNGTSVRMYISVGRQTPVGYLIINKTSVLSVSIWFIVLMVISLAWLIF